MAAFAEGEPGFCDASSTGNFEVAEDASAWQCPPWGQAVMPQDASMPFWDPQGEEVQNQETIFGYHTEPCSDFQNGFCSLHKKGKATSTCFCYHFESQHRRPPADRATGRLLYWDVPCTSIATDSGSSCPHGDECIFAHSREEISYHPAKYKTRRCNGRGCRGESICCFAHSEAEVREWAPERYSYWAMMTGSGRGPTPPDLASADTDAWPAAAAAEDWQRPMFALSQLPATRHKQRFCASYPDVSQCRRGAACAFAHSREEARTPLLTIEQEQQSPSALTEDFFMYQFKTLWCPIGVQHDWQTCVYAHNYQDARRRVDIGYGPKPCPFWAKKDPNAEYAQRCPLGLRCPFSHGAKEQLYHPQYFRSVICRDLRGGKCPRVKLCAFFHKRNERRKAPADNTNYNLPLKEDDLDPTWVNDFLLPPFRDAAPQGSAPDDPDAMHLGLGQLDEDADEQNQYWCPPSAYWNPNSGFSGEMSDISSAMIGMCPDMVEPDMSHQDNRHSGLGISGSPYPASQADVSNHDPAAWRPSPLPPALLGEDKDDSPRNSDEGDAADDASTSAGGDFLAAAGSLLSQAASRSAASTVPTAGTIGSGTTSSSANSSPWMIPSSQEPSWGPFGGAFDGYRGLLSTPIDAKNESPLALSIGTLHSSTKWDPNEPAMIS